MIPRNERTWWPDLDELSGGELTRYPVDQAGIIGGLLCRDLNTGHLTGGCFLRCESEEACDRVLDRICGQVYQGRTIEGRKAEFGCIPTNKRRQMERYRRGEPFSIGEVRWAQLLLNVPDMFNDIDDGSYRLAVDEDKCLFCHDQGHQRTDCPVLRDLVKDGQDYRCGKCEAINHHLMSLCPYPDDYGFANFHQGRG